MGQGTCPPVPCPPVPNNEMINMQKIVPHLWFDKEAKEAALFYTSLFEQSKILYNRVIKNPPPFNDSEIVGFELAGQQFVAISAGPYFKLNPTISLIVMCPKAEEMDKLWKALSEGGTELMPLYEYSLSNRYAWVQDRYGLSWHWREWIFQPLTTGMTWISLSMKPSH